MHRIVSLVTAAVLLFGLSACSEKKPPEQSVVQSKSVLTVIRGMFVSYEKKDHRSLMADTAESFQNRDALSRSLATVFEKYEVIRFNVQYTKMIIVVHDKGPTKASFNWDGEWTTAGGALLKNSGRTTLVFDPVTFKLLSIEGKNPFVPQQGEVPGAKQ